MGRALGVTERQLMELSDWRSSDAFSPAEKRALALADAMTATPVDVPASLVAELKADLGEKGLVELVAAISWENQRSRFNRPFDLGADGLSEGAFCPLPAAREPEARRA